MASAWGLAWGSAWGVAWGALEEQEKKFLPFGVFYPMRRDLEKKRKHVPLTVEAIFGPDWDKDTRPAKKTQPGATAQAVEPVQVVANVANQTMVSDEVAKLIGRIGEQARLDHSAQVLDMVRKKLRDDHQSKSQIDDDAAAMMLMLEMMD